MAVKAEVSGVIERPVETVFSFFADNHVRNHPRWDPYVELWLDSDAPIDVGTIIRRRNSRSSTPVDGTMEVVEFERDRAFGAITHDGPMEIRGRASFESLEPSVTKLTITADIPAMDDSMEGSMATAMERSMSSIKRLIETETD